MIYFIKNHKTSEIKIGFSRHPQKRIKVLQRQEKAKLSILCTFKGTISQENYIHKLLKKYNTRREWFLFKNIAILNMNKNNFVGDVIIKNDIVNIVGKSDKDVLRKHLQEKSPSFEW
jgi:hypothetical protein